MKRKNLHYLVPLLLLFAFSSQAQIIVPSLEFTLQPMEENNMLNWGVYVKPAQGFKEPTIPVIATGQVTLLLRNNGIDAIENIQSINGNWNGTIETVNGPLEAPDINYFFIGFIDDGQGIELENEKETLLLTLQLTNCPDTIALIDNKIDPFNKLPNSESNNPGMDLEVYNVASNEIYTWGSNYTTTEHNCGATTTPTHEAITEGVLNFYPNPAEQFIHLDWMGSSDAQLSVFDLSNQTILTQQTLPTTQQIDISSFNAGMYFIKIQSGNKQYYTKFVKK